MVGAPWIPGAAKPSGGCHGTLSAFLVSGHASGRCGTDIRGAPLPVSFADGSPSSETIAKANKGSIRLFKKLQRVMTRTTLARQALDSKIAQTMAAMRPLCRDYLRQRAELRNVTSGLCVAAQGRVNAADLPANGSGPPACLLTPPSGTTPEGTPVVLPAQPCSHAQRRLLCTERLRQLADGDPGPGDKVNAPSMAANIRKWCHPNFLMIPEPISEALSRGAPDTIEKA